MTTKRRKSPIPNQRGPIEIVKQGSISVPIYATANRIFRLNPANGRRELKSQHPQFTLAYYEGTRRVKRKFSRLDDAKREANLTAIKLATGESEALKLTGLDRAAYVHAKQRLAQWRADADLGSAVNDFVASARRLPEGVSFQEAVNFYLSRHPAGLPRRTVREVLDEMLLVKTIAGVSEPYAKELRLRLGQFADSFSVPISTVSSKQIQEWLANRRVGARTHNNYRRLICTLFKFAIRRGYLPKDHDELSGVERVKGSGGEIEVFTPDELRKLFAACVVPVKERNKWRDRQAMLPYLAIAAFCGLRAAEIQRLDWSEVHLTGAERFIEVKASKAKTASRRTVPIPDNCAAWLAQYAKPSGLIAPYQRTDKQLFIYLARKAGVPWKHNGLRHSYISYRLAVIKNVHQVSLEAGNSPQMVFAHYRQLVRDSEAADWFSTAPAKEAANIVPMQTAAVG